MLRSGLAVFLGLIGAHPVAAQAVVEGALGAGRAATTTAPVQGVGKSMSGLAGALDKALKQAPASNSSAPSTAAVRVPAEKLAAPAPDKQKREDAAAIEAGIGYDDLLRRFGQPSMSLTDEDGRTLTYAGKDGTYTVGVVDGKVKSVEKPAAKPAGGS